MKSSKGGVADPIYQSIPFGERINPPSGYLDEFDSEYMKGVMLPKSERVLGSADFLRIKHLHQNGLAWLSFPSATHTTFSHAIGTWWLAHVASERIKVYYEPDEHAISLKRWLHENSVYGEFVSASLLNSIGQPAVPLPFLPSDDDGNILELFDDNTDQMIQGGTKLSNQWNSIAGEKFGKDSMTVNQILADSELSGIDKKKISRIVKKRVAPESSEIGVRVVWDLLNGTIDLNNIDALLRDSYFTGIRQTSINVNSLLGNISLYINSAEKDYKWVIGRDGLPYCENILFNKKQLNALVLHNSEVIAYNAMILGSIKSHLKEVNNSNLDSEKIKISLMDDAELLSYLRQSTSNDAARYSSDLSNSAPFGFVYRFSRGKMSTGRLLELREELRQVRSDYNYLSGFILLFDRGFWNDSLNENFPWLNPKFIHSNKNGELFKMDDEYMYEYDKLFLPKFHYVWLISRSYSDETRKALSVLKSYLQEC